jgi:acetyltransferase-like isoleucine patch superfamily enzyme
MSKNSSGKRLMSIALQGNRRKVIAFLRMALPDKLDYVRRIFAKFRATAPRGMQAGVDVQIYRPHRISNAARIRVGNRTIIGAGAVIAPILEYAGLKYSPTIEIGSDVYIGPSLYMACIGRLTIGDGSVLSENVYINDTSHGFDPEAGLIMQQALVHPGDITIGNHCFLGLRSAVMPGVTLGDHCIVGTSSVVTKSFPAYSMIAGAPAVLIKRYSAEQRAWIRIARE